MDFFHDTKNSLQIIVMEMPHFPLCFRKHKKQLDGCVEISMILIFIIQTTLSFKLHHCHLLYAPPYLSKAYLPTSLQPQGNCSLCSDLLRSSPIPDTHTHTLK